jgi:CHASE3 domain sensor protein
LESTGRRLPLLRLVFAGFVCSLFVCALYSFHLLIIVTDIRIDTEKYRHRDFLGTKEFYWASL